MGTDFITMECNLQSREGITDDELAALVAEAYEHGFIAIGSDHPCRFEVDNHKVHPNWDNFFAKNARYLSPGSVFCVFDSNDCLYGYRIATDDGRLTFLEGSVDWEQLDTLTVERPIEEIRAACAGRTRMAGRDDFLTPLFPNLAAAIDAYPGSLGAGITLLEENVNDGGWVVTLHGSTATLTLPRDELGADGSLPEGKVAGDEGLGGELRGGDAEAREGLDSGEGGAPQQ